MSSEQPQNDGQVAEAAPAPLRRFGEITSEDIDNWFTYHAPTPDQAERYAALRAQFKTLANLVVALTPSCPDQTVAIRMLREAAMAANQAIACNE